MAPPKHITILGGGLSGLTTAYRLATRLPSSRITLLDGAPRLGGWVDSTRHAIRFRDNDRSGSGSESGMEHSGEVVLEGGPRTIRPRGSRGAPKMLKLIDDLGLRSEIIAIPKTHPAATSRFLLDLVSSNGDSPQLTRLPSSLLSILKPQPRLLRGLVRNAALEPFRPRPRPRPPSSSSDGPNADKAADESVHSFFSRRFGPDIATNLASAMVHGIYAADSRALSLRAAFPSLWEAERAWGSVVLGMIMGGGGGKEAARERERDWAEVDPAWRKEVGGWSLYGLRGGLGRLTGRLEEECERMGVDIGRGEEVREVKRVVDGVEIRTPKRTISTSHLISALPLAPLVSLFPATLPAPLAATPYTSVGVINLVLPLPSHALHPAGFGYLVPRTEPHLNPEGILGVIFDSTALPGVDASATPPTPAHEHKQEQGVDAHVTKLTVMMGGPHWSSYSHHGDSQQRSPRPTTAEELIAPALAHLRRVFPILRDVEPLVVLPRSHERCIPTYQPGHGDSLRELHGRLRVRSESEPEPKSEPKLSEKRGSVQDEHNSGRGPWAWAGRLSLVGNAFGGVGVNDCVFSAEEVVQGLVDGERPTGLERWADWT